MPNLSVAIPDSALSDEQTKRDKSVKTAQFARACSIFRVKKIYLYHDYIAQFERENTGLLKTVLQYLDTPQYLRKILYPKMRQLEFAGILHPIKAPHHKAAQDIKSIRVGDVRVGVLAKVKGQLFAEVGLGSIVPFSGQGFEGKKINVKFVSAFPNIRTVEADENDINGYWGFEVKEVPSISKLIASIENTEVLVTSRKGSYFGNIEAKFVERMKQVQNLLVIFGAPKHGVHELITKEGGSIKSFSYVVNMFPNQGTETVRLEEALLGSLAILNNALVSAGK